MINKIDHTNMGSFKNEWLNTIYHFSFNNYYNPENINFGSLRVINDDIISPNTGFPTHPHKDMEIITYIIEGELSHKDSMGNISTIIPGQIQYMSAGKGVFHSEFNESNDFTRLLQIWIYPDKRDHEPDYGDYTYDIDQQKNQWLHLVSPKSGPAPVKINQDSNIYTMTLEKGISGSFTIPKGRQGYLVQVKGSSTINNIHLSERDALTAIEENIYITSEESSQYLLIEMKKK